LQVPSGVAVDQSGNLYFVDLRAVYKMAAATGAITTVESLNQTPAFYNGFLPAVAVDGSGNLYIANGYVVQKVAAATGIVSTAAGNGQAGYSGDGGLAVNAELGGVSGVAVDASGNLYIADTLNNAIRKVTASNGIITTVAGKGPKSVGFSGDGGPATSAEFSLPGAVTVDSSGNIYVADTGNNRIRLLAPEYSRPVLTVTKTHPSSFTLGQAGATYSVVVSNAANAGATSGVVTVSDAVPAGLTLQSMSGVGWSCAANGACARSDSLRAGTSYPAITVTVNVGDDAPSQAINQATLAGGGSASAAASDTTDILPNAAQRAVVTTVSAASGAAPVTADSIVSMYGVNISTATFAASAGPPAPLPTALGGVSATVTDSSGKTAPVGLIVVTPNQVNAVLPAGLATGVATIDLVTGSGPIISGDVTLVTAAPSLFTANESGKGTASAQVVIAHQDGSHTFIGAIASCNASGCTPIPIDLGSSTDPAVLELFGTGIRGAGGAANVTVTVGNTQGTVQYAGAQGGGTAGSYYGLDQVNVLLPRSLVGAGTVNVVLTADGQTANTVTVDIE